MVSVALAAGLALVAATAGAQTRVGELLDAGGVRVSAEQFRRDVVQNVIAGPLEGGISAEVVFTGRGTLEGAGSTGRSSAESMEVRGTWSFGQNDTVCVAVVLDGPTIRANYPRRCRAWFRLGDRYYTADSSDRSARLLVRTVK
jgi:hypothetical protein